MRAVVLALALAVTSTVSARAQAQSDLGLTLAVARSYRADAQQTAVDAFCAVPFSLLEALSGGRDGVAMYRVAVTVRDSSGLELLRDSWTQRVAARILSVPQGSAAEHFRFAARAGRYTVDVVVTDSASGRRSTVSAAVDAYADAPGVSDLLLATGIRAVEGIDTVPRAGEVRKGMLFLQTAARPVLTPQHADLGYYLEVYAPQPDTGTVSLRVLRADGSQVVAIRPQQVVLEQGGGVAQGLIPLAGLPAGEYTLAATVARAHAERPATTTAPFRMAGFETEAAMAAVTRAEVRSVFESMTESQLDTLYLPLVYLMNANEQGIYPSLTLIGKRGYMRDFWAKRDPTPGTVRNEAQEDFYARINEANRRFREGGAAEVPGWRTDRGRIFIRYGAADAVLAQPQAGNTNPYEVWKFTRVKALKYVFMDLTGFGNYALIWTDDIREPSRPNWRELLGSEALMEVERF